MSWEKAMQEAGKWLSGLPLPNPIKGEFVNLADHAGSLTFEGGFREMVIRAAIRQLEKRGARAVWSPVD